MIGLPNHDDLQNILKAWFPNLECLSGKLVGGCKLVSCFLFQIIHHFAKIVVLFSQKLLNELTISVSIISGDFSLGIPLSVDHRADFL